MPSSFKCNLCSAIFSLDLASLQGEIHLHACEKCGALCYLKRLNQTLPGKNLLELYGCSAASGDAYEPTAADEISIPTETRLALPATAPETMLHWIQEEAESREEAALEGTLSEWKIIRLSGQEYRFNFLTALRKWIMDGRIKPGDTLLASGGAKYLIEEYPGTADLFQNIDVMRERRRQVLDVKKRRQKSQPSKFRYWIKRPLEMTLVALALLVVVGAVGYWAWQRHLYQESLKQAQSYLDSLVRLNLASTSAMSPDALKRLVWLDDQESIKEGIAQLTSVLAKDPGNQENVCLFTEALVRRAMITANISEMHLARSLLNLVAKRATDFDRRHLSEAVYFWSQGVHAKASEHVALYLKTAQDPYGFFLRALIALDQLDLLSAKADLARASQLQPDNTLFLLALEKIYAKEQKWNEAIALLMNGLDKNPNDVEMLKRLGACYEGSGSFNEAEQTYQRGLQMTNAPEEFQYLLVALFSQVQKLPETIRAASRYVDLYPQGPHVRLVEEFSEIAQRSVEQKRQEARDEQLRETAPTRSRQRIGTRR